MKKRLFAFTLFFICSILFFTTTIHASNYVIEDTDISIEIDDTRWYVFTRNNIRFNDQLTSLGISFSTMNNIFQNNNVYIDALLIYSDGNYVELICSKQSEDNIINLSNYDDNEISSYAKKLTRARNAEQYSIYNSQYKFIKIDYTYNNLYIRDYVTVVNGEKYILSFQTTKPFSVTEYVEIRDIIDSTYFDVDTTLKEEKNKLSLLQHSIIRFFIVLAFCSIFFIIRRKKISTQINEKNKEYNRKKDNRKIKRSLAIILFVFQALGIIGSICNGSFIELFTGDLAYLIGYFIWSIIAIILLISSHRETLSIEGADQQEIYINDEYDNENNDKNDDYLN